MFARYTTLFTALLLVTAAHAQTWERLDVSRGFDPGSYDRGFFEVHNANGTLFATHNGLVGGVPMMDMYTSTDGGETWSALPALPTNLAPNSRLSSSGSRWFVHDDGIAYSDDAGATWTLATGIAGDVWTIREGTGALYAATQTDGYRSTDDGATWTALGIADLGRDLIETQAGSLVYISFLNGIYRSTDGGTTWTQVYTDTVPEVLLEVASGRLFVKSATLVNLISDDDGQTWSTTGGSDNIQRTERSGSEAVWLAEGIAFNRNGGLPDLDITYNFPISALNRPCSNRVAFTDQYLYAAGNCLETNGADDRQGIWRLDLSTVVAAEQPAPTSDAALALWPNPARDAATLHFTASERGPTTIHVFDALGRMVRETTIHAAPGQSVAHRFDTSSLPAGRYLVRILSGEQAQTTTLSVVR